VFGDTDQTAILSAQGGPLQGKADRDPSSHPGPGNPGGQRNPGSE